MTYLKDESAARTAVNLAFNAESCRDGTADGLQSLTD